LLSHKQELLATGLACMGGSLFGCIAASTSPPRCFLLEGTGGRTQLSHLVSASVVLLTVFFVAPLFKALPICVLASIILVACIPLFGDFIAWRTYFKTDRCVHIHYIFECCSLFVVSSSGDYLKWYYWQVNYHFWIQFGFSLEYDSNLNPVAMDVLKNCL